MSTMTDTTTYPRAYNNIIQTQTSMSDHLADHWTEEIANEVVFKIRRSGCCGRKVSFQSGRRQYTPQVNPPQKSPSFPFFYILITFQLITRVALPIKSTLKWPKMAPRAGNISTSSKSQRIEYKLRSTSNPRHTNTLEWVQRQYTAIYSL